MHSGQYDKDCTTWNPSGEIVQIKHAMAAAEQGTPLVGLRSKTASVLAVFKKRQQADFSSYDKKLFKIDNHCAIGISGLTADARVLADYMRTECLEHKYVFDEPMAIGRLVAQIGDKSAKKTLQMGKRPYGVGMLISSYDPATGPHIYQTVPSGEYFEFYGMSMGKTSQSAKTYLEKHYETFPDASDEQLIKHAVKALSVTVSAQNEGMKVDNVDVSVITKSGLKIYTAAELKPYIDEVEDKSAPAPMEVS